MASINKTTPITTHEGGKAVRINDVEQLRRYVMSCFLWEKEFYENGVDIATRIYDLACTMRASTVAEIAIEARNVAKLRHVPLVLLSALCKAGKGTSIVQYTFPQVIKRADELSEFLVVHAKLNKTTPDKLKKVISAQAKKGLARAFHNFDAYQLAKYNRDGAVKLRDVLFLCHAKPKTYEQEQLWKQLVDNTLPAPDTWEVLLSSGADKRETFTRLIQENKLGYMALLRNIRNMHENGVSRKLIETAIRNRKGAENVLPFRYTAAARVMPSYEPVLDEMMQHSINSLPKLLGTTVVLVDVSGSMDCKLSHKSDLTRLDAAATLGACVNAETLRVFSFSSRCVEVPPRRGMAGIDAITRSQSHTSTNLRAALEEINKTVVYDRIIVITDEQSSDGTGVPLPGAKGYMLNVASNRNGVGYRRWVHIDGFSENVLRFIHEYEKTV